MKKIIEDGILKLSNENHFHDDYEKLKNTIIADFEDVISKAFTEKNYQLRHVKVGAAIERLFGYHGFTARYFFQVWFENFRYLDTGLNFARLREVSLNDHYHNIKTRISNTHGNKCLNLHMLRYEEIDQIVNFFINFKGALNPNAFNSRGPFHYLTGRKWVAACKSMYALAKLIMDERDDDYKIKIKNKN